MKERGNSEDLDIDGAILLSGWSKNWRVGGYGLYSGVFRLGHSGGLLLTR
jgi:hypothetical protein